MNAQRARILLFTGQGKGKTTAAYGMALRFLARDRRVLVARFCKNRSSGEVDALARFPNARIVSSSHGMTPPPSHPDFPAHAAAAAALFETVRGLAPGFDLLVLDEICGAAARGLVDEKVVAAFLRTLRPDQAAALTGRDAGMALLAAADTASETLCLKHVHDRGTEAQEGVEF